VTGPRLSRPSLATFDLDYLDTLSDSPEFLLSISEQTFYVLLNLVNADVKNPFRYAIGYSDQHYQPVRESDSEWLVYQEVMERVQLEVYDVAPELLDILEDIRRRQTPEQTNGEETSGTATSTNHSEVFTTVSEEEVWIIENMTAWFTVAPCSEIRFQIYVSGEWQNVYAVQSPSATVRYTYNPHIHMLNPGKVRFQFRGCTSGTTTFACSYLYGIKID